MQSHDVESRDGAAAVARTTVADAAVSSRFAIGADAVRLLALIAVTVGLIALCAMLAVPFFPAITWGIALAILAWPIHQRLCQWIPFSPVAAAVTTLGIAAVIVSGGMFVAYQIAHETGTAAGQLPGESIEGSIRTTLEESPITQQAVAWMDQVGLDIESQIRRFIDDSTSDLRGLARGSASAAMQFLVTLFILFYLLLDRAWFVQALRDYLPISRKECDQLTASVVKSVHANLYATLVTASIDSICGGLLFWRLGLPAPMVWTVVMFILSILPMVGAAMVWVPAAIYLTFLENYWGAAILVAWGLTSFILVGNLLYVRLAGQRMSLHAVPAMIAFLGGIAVFGISGMILGPAVFAVTSEVLQLWKRRMQNPAGPAKSPPHIELAGSVSSPAPSTRSRDISQ